MSRATVEFVERFFDAFDRHDESALLDLVHPDVEFRSLIVEVEGGFHGHEGVHLYLRERFAAFRTSASRPMRFAQSEGRRRG
jgi:ketosteroid isomerase-like protein